MVSNITEDMLNVLRCVHVNVPWKLMPQYLPTILELGMNVEIGFEAEELDRVPRSEFRDVAGELHRRGCGITFHGPFWDLSTGSVDRFVRHISRLRIQQALDLADVFRPVQIVCHTGYDPRHHGGQWLSWIERSMEVWEPLVCQAERLKTPLLLENVWEKNPDLHWELFRRIDSTHFGFCLDVGHQNSFSEIPLATWVTSLSDPLREIHIHDNDGSCDAHLPVGKGSINFDGLFSQLNQNGMKPLLTLEPHREEHLIETLEGLHRLWKAREGDYCKWRS
jgi:sugar phosphate isomerase/epimerase